MLIFNKAPDRPLWESECKKYMVEQAPHGKGEPVYFCYTKNRIGSQEWKFLGVRQTPEIAKEYCSIMAGYQ